ncbi:tapasin-related protein isoform X3 [Dromaius novaehollandiae]|uniref:tapasin-related protein isoform X3 n=1 Tax=Dromaius novaehollandiae TaxID=8790 RepID=UPI00311D5EAA
MIQELLFFCGLLGLHAGSTNDRTATPPFRTVDIVLECSYLGEAPKGLLGAFGGSFSKDLATLVLRDVSVRDDGSLGEATHYKVPWKSAGSSSRIIFEASVELQSSSCNTSLRTHLGGLVTLDCHFALAPSSLLSSLEWRRQHRGSGRRLFRYQAGSTGPRVEPKVHVDLPQLLGNGDASLKLQEVNVEDEGTYMCLVSTPQHQIQHVIQLQVAEPPRVRVIPEQVSFKRDVTTTLTCDIAGYYPLDVSVSWTQKTAEDEAEITLSSIRFSSHQQSQDGTYSITSYLSISSATVQAPATYSCHVSHVALEEPISVSAYLKAPEKTGSEGLVGGFIATVIFSIVLFIVLRRKRTDQKFEAASSISRAYHYSLLLDPLSE